MVCHRCRGLGTLPQGRHAPKVDEWSLNRSPCTYPFCPFPCMPARALGNIPHFQFGFGSVTHWI